MRYLIYTRVSPKGSGWDVGETTVGDQASQCRAFVIATDPQGEIVDVITDEFESGASAKRPGWMRILHEVKTGTALWDVLVVRHLDRFSRSMADAVTALELFHQSGKFLIAMAQGLNSSTPSGRGVINILLSIAQMERDFCSERVKLKMTSIASKGGWPPGNPPYGYKRGEKHDNRLYLDRVKSENVRQIFIRYRSGAGSHELSKDFGIPKNTILWILKNRVYLGVIPYGGKEYKGLHDPIIDAKLFNDVQRLIPKSCTTPRIKMQKYPYILTGLLYCKCGRTMSPASANGRTLKYHYYQCTDTVKCKERVRAEQIETAVIDTLKKIKLTKKDIERIVEEIRNIVLNQARGDTELRDLEKATRAAKERQDSIAHMFETGRVTESNAALINQKLTKAINEYNDLLGRLSAAKAVSGTSRESMEDMIHYTRSINTLGESIEKTIHPDELRVLCSTWIKEIRRTGDEVQITLNIPGSSKYTVWRALLDQNEPFFILSNGKINLYAI